MKIEREVDEMKRVVYEIYDKKGKYFITVVTEAKKKEAEKNGYTVTDKVEEVETFQPWKEKEEAPKRKPSKYHKFVMDRYQ